MPCHRVYRLYAVASGVVEIDPKTRSIFNKAMYRGIQRRRLLDRDENGAPGQVDRIVRLAGTPEVTIRQRGERMLSEIPPSEIAAAMQAIDGGSRERSRHDWDNLFTELLRQYGLERHPDNVWQTSVLHWAIVAAAGADAGDGASQLPLAAGAIQHD
ncbi:MAG: hypothetical protein IT337_04075 [Thermomicrobiales bacterium]|nr:hypothetical protein [Thermomicrobiales bacterium]